MRKEYHKLVRDRIPEIIQRDGRRYEVRVAASDEEYIQLLRAKVIEEAQEVATAASDAEILKELADLYEVIDSLVAAKGLDTQAIRSKQQQRRLERGGFAERLCLLWVE